MPGPASMGARLLQAAVLLNGPVVQPATTPKLVTPSLPYIGWLNAYERRWADYQGTPLAWCDYTDPMGRCDLKPGHSEPWHVRGDGLAWFAA